MRFGYDAPPLSLPITSNLLPPDSPTSIGRRRPSFRIPTALSSNLFPKLALIILAIHVAFFMAYFPSPPKFSLVSAEFKLHTLTPIQISGEWNVTFSLANPIGGSYYEFRNIDVAVFSSRKRLAESHVAKPSSPEKTNGVEIETRLMSPAQYLNDDVLRGILVDRSDGFVRFDFEISAESLFKPVFIGPLVNYRKVGCNGVRFEFSGEGEGNFGIAKIEPTTCGGSSFWNI